MFVDVFFEGRKIKKLLGQYIAAETNIDELTVLSDLEKFGKSALKHTIEAFQQKRLTAEKAQRLLKKICDDSDLKDFVLLLGEPYDEVRRVAKEMIMKRWERPSVPFLVELLKSSNLYARTNAIELLTMFRDLSCVPMLISIFNGADPEFKKGIIKILSEINDEPSKKLIISALNDDAWQVRLFAVKRLSKMKDPASVSPLLERLQDRDPQMNKLVMDALGAIGDKRAARPVLELLRDNDLMVRQKATECLIQVADADIVPDIVDLLANEDVNVRRCAVEVLNNLKDTNTCDALMKAMRDSDWWVRQIATDCLTDLKGSRVVEGFIAMIRSRDESLRRCAVEFFNRVADISAYEPLMGLLNDPDWWVREKAITALALLRDPRAVESLAKRLEDEEVKWVVPAALAEIGGARAIELLKVCLADKNHRMRIEAILGLCKLKTQDAVSDIKETLADPHEEVRIAAANALKELTGKSFPLRDMAAAEQTVMLRQSHPAGTTVIEAIVVIDMCNSTEIVTRYGNEFSFSLFKTLAQMVSAGAQKAECCFQKGTGDGFLLTFPATNNAVGFAREVLARIKASNTIVEPIKKIDLRMAVHFGECKLDPAGDRLGLAVNTAFRVEGLKPEGLIPLEGSMTKEEMPVKNRIFLTETVAREIQDMPGIEARLVGLFELKGITGLHRIFMLTSKEQ